MREFWLKIWLWMKVSVFLVIAVYCLAFVSMNISTEAPLWVGPRKTISANLLTLAFGAFATGVLTTLLVRTTIKTLRQFREISRPPERRGFDVLAAPPGASRLSGGDAKSAKP